jgi:NTE family protein
MEGLFMKIDAAFSGGGIKGIALIGALMEVESKGFKVERAAGTSAGSIIAAFSIAGYDAEAILEMVSKDDTSHFLDSRKTFIRLPFQKWIGLYWQMGLYRGKTLEKWLSQKLAEKGVKTFRDLPENSLKIIASDLTRGRLLVLPDDLKDYGLDPEQFSVAKAVRMSCGLPYFFEPVKLFNTNGEKSIIVDGGILSNFPMWLFKSDDKKQKRPVIGFKLSTSLTNMPPNKINNAFGLFGALFETMKDAHDARYISKRFEEHIIFIPVDSIKSTEFQLTEERKNQLVEFGRKRAASFLRNWSF